MSVDAIHRGLDTQAAAAAFAPIADFELRNHDGVDIATDPEMTAFSSRCQQALKRAIWEEQHALSPYLYADPLDGVQLGERDKVTDPRIVYYIGATRASAAIMVSRLILALYHPSHLFLVHVDLKAEGVYEQIANVIRQHPNIHMMGTRRLVQACGTPAVVPNARCLHAALSVRTAVGRVDDDAPVSRRYQDHHGQDGRLRLCDQPIGCRHRPADKRGDPALPAPVPGAQPRADPHG